ncbi:MAG: hypothetical protein E7352_05175 [Clostridiales bacterium]|nr:hypothetical protein [Clostridiales bacterium]
MKKTKKIGALILALGVFSAVGFTSCGGDGVKGNNSGSSASESSSAVDGEDGKMASEDWETVISAFLATDNVTYCADVTQVRTSRNLEWVGTQTAKLADGVSYVMEVFTETYNGEVLEGSEEWYIYEKNGLTLQMYRDSYETTEWALTQYDNPYYAPTIVGEALSKIALTEDALARYDAFSYDKMSNEYSMTDNGVTIKLTIKGDKVEKLSFYEGTESGYTDVRYTFSDYGVTVIGEIPSLE